MSTIVVSVRNQELRIVSYFSRIVVGSNKFVKFHFDMDPGWHNMDIVAQFEQGGAIYHVDLDENHDAYLPAGIMAGACTLMLYGVGGNTIGTTNHLRLTVEGEAE